MNIIFKTKMSNHHLYPNQSDSTSLWNYSLFPGWSEEEVEVLKIALIKYGIGHWTRIQKVNCLPGKTIVQMYLQTQRLIGQQSLAEFMGLHVNLEKIFLDNKKKVNVLRKNNYIINTGDNLTTEKKNKLLQENKDKYEYPSSYYKNLKIPRLLSNSIGRHLTIKQVMDAKNNLTIQEKIEELTNLVNCMNKKIEIIEQIELNKKRKREENNNKENKEVFFSIFVKKKINENNEIIYELEK